MSSPHPSPLPQRMLLSQNFLNDPRLVASLLDKTRLDSESVVLEIGPGGGIITEQLARRYRRVIAVEKDPSLARILQRTFQDWPGVTIHSGDFLEYHLPRTPYNVVANIPFNITSAVVTKLTTAANPPGDAYLVVQREAADMLLGRPRDTLRSILLKPWFEPSVTHHFQRRDFIPAPRVDVVMLRLRKRGPPLISTHDRQPFRDFVTYVFTHWQRTRHSPLADLFTQRQLRFIAHACGFDPDVHPTFISFEHWLTLFGQLKVVASMEALQRIQGSEARLLAQQSRLQKRHRTRTGRRKTGAKCEPVL